MYLWIKVVHIVAMISWMAGMLYLPRLFVYHCEAAAGSVQSETFKTMERRLLKGIINPAMVVTWLAGLWLAWDHQLFREHWMSAKFLLVLIMSGLNGFLSKTVKVFGLDENTRPARFYRVLNEVPAVLMVLIVILVIVRPF